MLEPFIFDLINCGKFFELDRYMDNCKRRKIRQKVVSNALVSLNPSIS